MGGVPETPASARFSAGGPAPEAGFVLAHGYDLGFTTNVPLAGFLAEDALIPIAHDGEPLNPDHAGSAADRPATLHVEERHGW